MKGLKTGFWKKDCKIHANNFHNQDILRNLRHFSKNRSLKHNLLKTKY